MMQMSTPGAASDLTALLEILQLASDPAKSKAMVEHLTSAHKQHTDAIVAATEREHAAQAAEAAAKRAIEQAAQSEAVAAAEVDKLLRLRAYNKGVEDEAKAALDAATRANDEKLKSLNAAQADIDARTAHMAKSFREKSAAIDAEKVRVTELENKAKTMMEEALAMKAEYAARLAKIKALAE